MSDALHDPDEFLSQLLSSPPMTVSFDIDKATVMPGSPGVFDGLVIAQWADQ